jgi:hypothetical protein
MNCFKQLTNAWLSALTKNKYSDSLNLLMIPKQKKRTKLETQCGSPSVGVIDYSGDCHV